VYLLFLQPYICIVCCVQVRKEVQDCRVIGVFQASMDLTVDPAQLVVKVNQELMVYQVSSRSLVCIKETQYMVRNRCKGNIKMKVTIRK